ETKETGHSCPVCDPSCACVRASRTTQECAVSLSQPRANKAFQTYAVFTSERLKQCAAPRVTHAHTAVLIDLRHRHLETEVRQAQRVAEFGERLHLPAFGCVGAAVDRE